MINTQERILLITKLGEYLLNNDAELEEVKTNAALENSWFIPEFIDLAVKNTATCFLQKKVLEKWAAAYNIPDENKINKSVGLVMAGNIPLVGFHDLLCVFISGQKAVIKPSSKDIVLIKHITDKLAEWNNETKDYISFAENLKGCDAYIATGSNNSGRYFEYYFGKYPNIIRRNRTSVAVLEGNETKEELGLLADDIQLYFGLGCRNVTKLYVPEGYDFIPLLTALKKYDHYFDFHKYKNNYDYQLALLLLNNKKYMSTNAVLLSENTSLFSPVSEVHYEFYTNKNEATAGLLNNAELQCIVGKGFIPYGMAQYPSLTDYADGVDTMQFLTRLI